MSFICLPSGLIREPESAEEETLALLWADQPLLEALADLGDASIPFHHLERSPCSVYSTSLSVCSEPRLARYHLSVDDGDAFSYNENME